MKSISLQNLTYDKINSKLENNTKEYIEKLNLKCESNVIKNPNQLFSLYKSNEIKQFMFSLFSELNSLEEFFMSNFIKEMKNKSDVEVRGFFPQKKKEYKDRINLILEKAKKELISNKNLIEKLKQKNIELKNDVNILKNQKNIINEELLDKDITIKILNDKYKIYCQIKNIFDNFSYGFNYEEKKTMEQNILDVKNQFYLNKNLIEEVSEELKERKNKIKELKQNMIQEDIEYRNSIYELYDKLSYLEQNNKQNEKQNKKKLLSLKHDINLNKELIKEYEKFQKCFISIFNLLQGKLNLERNIIKTHKNFDLIKSDYTPKIYNIEELVNYMNLMLIDSNEETSSSLLREIVSYIHMMLREKNIDLIKAEYDPVKSIIEIEKNLILSQKENEALNEKISNFQNKIINEKKNIKRLNEQIKNIKKMHDELQKTLKEKYNNKKYKKIRKSFSANILKPSQNIQDLKKDKNETNINLIKNKFNEQEEEDKEPFFKNNLENLIDRINKLYFGRVRNKKLNENELDVFSTIKNRIQKKLHKLDILRKNNKNYFTVENNINTNINRNIDKLIFDIEKKYK